MPNPPLTEGWGSLTGAMPTAIKRMTMRGDRSLNNRPLDIVHNHKTRKPIIRYAGYSKTAPQYHLFQCVQVSDPPRKRVTLVKFDGARFTSDSKAGHGGCSMRHCPGEAVTMNPQGKQAYCARCAQRVTGQVPCSWTSILGCTQRMGLDQKPHPTPCPVCAQFEGIVS